MTRLDISIYQMKANEETPMRCGRSEIDERDQSHTSSMLSSWSYFLGY